MGDLNITNTDDFTAPTRHTDLVLIVGRTLLHVSKAVLASCSPVFDTMFFGDFAERNKKEIELIGKEAGDIQELLRAIVMRPYLKPVGNDNVCILLELADEYDIKFLKEKCIKFLVKRWASSEDFVREAAKLAGRYKLNRVLTACLPFFVKHPPKYNDHELLACLPVQYVTYIWQEHAADISSDRGSSYDSLRARYGQREYISYECSSPHYYSPSSPQYSPTSPSYYPAPDSPRFNPSSPKYQPTMRYDTKPTWGNDGLPDDWYTWKVNRADSTNSGGQTQASASGPPTKKYRSGK